MPESSNPIVGTYGPTSHAQAGAESNQKAVPSNIAGFIMYASWWVCILCQPSQSKPRVASLGWSTRPSSISKCDQYVEKIIIIIGGLISLLWSGGRPVLRIRIRAQQYLRSCACPRKSSEIHSFVALHVKTFSYSRTKWPSRFSVLSTEYFRIKCPIPRQKPIHACTDNPIKYALNAIVSRT